MIDATKNPKVQICKTIVSESLSHMDNVGRYDVICD